MPVGRSGGAWPRRLPPGRPLRHREDVARLRPDDDGRARLRLRLVDLVLARLDRVVLEDGVDRQLDRLAVLGRVLLQAAGDLPPVDALLIRLAAVVPSAACCTPPRRPLAGDHACRPSWLVVPITSAVASLFGRPWPALTVVHAVVVDLQRSPIPCRVVGQEHARGQQHVVLGGSGAAVLSRILARRGPTSGPQSRWADVVQPRPAVICAGSAAILQGSGRHGHVARLFQPSRSAGERGKYVPACSPRRR